TAGPRTAAAGPRGRDPPAPPPSARPRASRPRARRAGRPGLQPPWPTTPIRGRYRASAPAVRTARAASRARPATTDGRRPGPGASIRRGRARRRTPRVAARAATPSRSSTRRADAQPPQRAAQRARYGRPRRGRARGSASGSAARRDPVHVEEPAQLPRVRRRLGDASERVLGILRRGVVVEEGVRLLALPRELPQRPHPLAELPARVAVVETLGRRAAALVPGREIAAVEADVRGGGRRGDDGRHEVLRRVRARRVDDDVAGADPLEEGEARGPVLVV